VTFQRRRHFTGVALALSSRLQYQQSQKIPALDSFGLGCYQKSVKTSNCKYRQFACYHGAVGIFTVLFIALFPLLVGVVAGVLGAMLGLGGGVVVVPSLELLGPLLIGSDWPLATIIGASQLGVLAVSVASSASYLGRSSGSPDPQPLVRTRLAFLLAPYTVWGGILGAVLGLVLPTKAIALVFVALLVYTGIELLRGMQKPELERTTPSIWARPAVFFGGIMSGLLGIGGGTVQVPVLNFLAGLPFRSAVATSTFMMGLTGLANVLIYSASGRFDLELAGAVALGILIGARLGANLASRVPVKVLRGLFALLVFYSAFNLVIKYVR
jgi:uncharacterized protein